MTDTTIPNDLRYTREDEWLRTDGDKVIVGITDYAQDQMGDVVFVELPEVGTTTTKGEPFGVIESVKAVSDLFAPMTGEVVAVNEALTDKPELVNEDCYGEGWLISIRPADGSGLEDALDAAAYTSYVGERAD